MELHSPYHLIPAAKDSTRREIYGRLLESKQIMDEQWDKPLLVKDVAVMIALSESRFYTLFRRVFQCSPNQYQARVKMNKALELHGQRCYTWTEIAVMLGFSDLPTFSKLFKRSFGVSPGNFQH